jgi:hypothetical protein
MGCMECVLIPINYINYAVIIIVIRSLFIVNK